MLKATEILALVICEIFRWLRLTLRTSQSIRAENLFLRHQLALYIERGVKPRRTDWRTRIRLTLLARFFAWQSALVVVRPETLLRWHRAGWKLLWRAKCRPGRPCIPQRLQVLIRRIASENPLWGEERIANELLLKLGIRVSPQTVNKYLPQPRGRPRSDLRKAIFFLPDMSSSYPHGRLRIN
jgi:putative transposase